MFGAHMNQQNVDLFSSHNKLDITELCVAAWMHSFLEHWK